MLDTDLNVLKFERLQRLVASGIREGRSLEFKRDLNVQSDKEKIEFLADLSAFSNTSGGDLVYGIGEDGGEANSIPGVELTDPDHEINRLNNLIRAGLEPRVPGIDIRWYESADGQGCLLVRVPKSFAAPHRVILKGHDKFYGRNSGGKHPLDVSELRSLFLMAGGLAHDVRRFRQERLSVIEADEGPLPLFLGAKLVIHIVPLTAFTESADFPIEDFKSDLRPITPFNNFGSRYTLDGFVAYGAVGDDGIAKTYKMVFRNGIVEAVKYIDYSDSKGPFVPASTIESGLIEAFNSYLDKAKTVGVDGPLHIFLSLLGVRGYRLAGARAYTDIEKPFRSEALLLPELVITDLTLAGHEAMRPLCNLLWNAFGAPSSQSFDADGNYRGDQY